MKFCKNCGEEIRPGVKVCRNCGRKVEVDVQEKSARPTTRDPEKNKRIGIIIGVVAVLAILLALAYSLISNVLSPDNQLDEIAEAVISEDAVGLRNAIDYDITLEEAEAYIAYINQTAGFSQYQTWIDDLKYYLDEQTPGNDVHDGSYTLLTVSSNGTQYLFFDDYNFMIPRLDVFASEDVIETFSFTMDGVEHQWKYLDEKFTELVPRIYEFEGTVVVGGEPYDSKVHVDFSEGNEAVLEHGLFYFSIRETITTKFREYISGDNITTRVNGEVVDVYLGNHENRVGPYHYSKELAVRATVYYAGETFESDTVTVKITEGEAENGYIHGGLRPVRIVELEFDEEAISEAIDAERTAEAAD